MGDLTSGSQCGCFFTTRCLHWPLTRAGTAGLCTRCQWGSQWWRGCWGHTARWRCCAWSPARWALGWESPRGDGVLRLGNTAPPLGSGARGGGGGARWLRGGWRQGQRRVRSPGLLASEPGRTVDPGSTRSSLLSRSIQQDNLSRDSKHHQNKRQTAFSCVWKRRSIHCSPP